MEEKEEKLSLSVELSIASITFIENLIMNLVVPILPFMVDFYMKDEYQGLAVPEDIISDYSGYLEGGFRLMQFFACIIW